MDTVPDDMYFNTNIRANGLFLITKLGIDFQNLIYLLMCVLKWNNFSVKISLGL